MITIKIQEITGDKCISYTQGKQLFDLIDDLLQKDLIVEMDMSDVVLSSSAFYNSSIGELIMKYDIDFLKERVKFKNLSDRDKFLLSRTISFAKKLKNKAA
jgi:hypothetical protein